MVVVLQVLERLLVREVAKRTFGVPLGVPISQKNCEQHYGDREVHAFSGQGSRTRSE